MATKAFLEKAYLAYFGRPVDPTGLTDYAASTDTQVADAFAASAESKALYGSSFNYAQINAIYLALFNREAEKAGLEYWYAKVADKTFTPAGAAMAILNGALNADKTAVENKLVASAAFTAALDTASEMIGYSGDAAAASARSFLSSVTATAATAAAVDAAVAAVVVAKNAVPAQTFTLTTGLDTITGTAGNDTLLGVLIGTAGGTGTTISVADNISMGAGTDTFEILTTAATAFDAAVLPTLSGVEVVKLKSLSGATSFVNTIAPDMTTLDLSSYIAASAMTVTAARSALRTVNISNSTQDVNDLTITYASTGSSTATDSLTFNLSSVDATADFDAADDALVIIQGAAAGTDSGIEQFVINATGTNKLETLSSLEATGQGSALNKITVTGSGSLAIATALVTDTVGSLTVDASTNTGGVTVSVGTTKTTFTGGSGNDRVIFATAGDLDANDIIDLGTGNNSIRVAETAMSTTTTALNAAINAVTTAQTVQFSAAVTGLNMNVLTATKVGSINNVNLTATNQSATDTFIISGNGVAARTVTVDGALGYTTVNLEYVAASLVASSSLATSVAANSTINIVSTSDSAALTNLTGTFTPAANATITVTGNGNITFGTTAGTGIALGATAFVNAAALTGILTVTGAAGANILTGGSAADTITGGAAADTLNGGAGADVINTGANATGTGDIVTPGLGADAVTVAYVATAATHTMSYIASAAESFATSVSTATTSMDTLTTHDVETAGSSTNTITFTTGVLSAGQTGAITVTATAPVMGTTAVVAFGFVVYSADTTPVSPVYFAYQDTDGDGILEAGEFAIKIVGSGDASDLETFTVTSGKLVNLITGA